MTSRLERINLQRQQKLDSLRSRGINPYPQTYHRTHTTREAIAALEDSEKKQVDAPSVNVAGRIMANRRMGKITFMDVRDTSGKIQLFLQTDRLDETASALLKDLDIGDIIGAVGRPFRTRTGEPTINVEQFTLLAKSLQPLPEKWHGLSDVDVRFRQRYLDLIANPEVKDTFIIRSRIVSAIRSFLDNRGFLEVETMMLQQSAGGALACPFITHHHALDQDLYLRIALELYLKRLIIGGMDKVYEMGRVFRNEGIDARHNPEFTLLESYEAYADYRDVMQMVEEMVSTVAQQALGTTRIKYGEETIEFKPPWQRLGLRQAVLTYSGIDFDSFPDADSLRAEMRRLNIEADPTKDRGRLIDDLISEYVEPKLVQPTFLLDYPIEMSPLAKSKPGDDRYVERFEAFAGCMEIANAFTELNDPIEQQKRFATQQECLRPGEEIQTIDQDFVLAMEHGMPPTGGLGIGIDRLVMLLTGRPSIREVILFPQLKEKG